MSADDLSADQLRRAVGVLRGGGVVAHATEGVWGLACDPADGTAVDRVLEIKGRDAEKGLIVAAGRAEAFATELEGLDDEVAGRIRESWPGAVTWVVPNRRFPHWITGGRDTVAIRVPGHEQARALADAFGGAIVSTSANRSGVEPARTARAVADALGEAVDFILPGEIGSSAGPEPNRRRVERQDAAMTDRYAVIGNPVDHSLSPRIHTAFATRTGEDIEYSRLEAPMDGFAAAARDFFARDGKGLNVTLPFKLDAWQWVDGHDDAALASGAVNTIVVDGHEKRGCNTDGIGLLRDLTDNLGWDLDGARTLVLGAGGAVQGVIEPLRRAGADVTIANRTQRKAQTLAARFGVASAGLDEVGGGWDVVLNGTAAGLAGIGGLIAPEAVAHVRCYDMFYALDGATPFCRWASDQGAGEVSDGLGMLIEQAAEAFLLWRSVRPDTGGIAKALRSDA